LGRLQNSGWAHRWLKGIGEGGAEVSFQDLGPRALCLVAQWFAVPVPHALDQTGTGLSVTFGDLTTCPGSTTSRWAALNLMRARV
jgi:hypothetical protein